VTSVGLDVNLVGSSIEKLVLHIWLWCAFSCAFVTFPVQI
jgi:hypothetical protein